MSTRASGGETRASDRTSLATEVASLRWFHTIDLGGGIVTPGETDPGRNVLPLLQMPERLDGKAVLDIGTANGFYAFEAERRGAARVLAIDVNRKTGERSDWRAAFDLAHKALRSQVEYAEVDVTELSTERFGRFDLVLFLGVLYHLERPIDGIAGAAAVTGGQLVLETELRLDWLPWPAATVFPGAELAGDASNWFAFNTRALLGLLRGAGLRDPKVVARTPQGRRVARVLYHRAQGAPWSRDASRRVVVHAYR